MKSFISIILVFGFTLITGKKVESLESNSIPDKEEVRKLNWSPNEYKVYLDQGEVKYQVFERHIPKTEIPFKIKPSKENSRFLGSKTSRTILKLDNGWLIGFDRGEWGGALYWFDQNGENSYEITNGNIKNIFKIENKIYVTEGLAHLGLNDGQILILSFENQKWSAKKYYNLEKVPYISELNKKNNLMIITSDKVLEFSIKKKEIKCLYKGFWNILYPNSLVIKDSSCYVGMRGGIFKIQLDNPDKQEWLTE